MFAATITGVEVPTTMRGGVVNNRRRGAAGAAAHKKKPRPVVSNAKSGRILEGFRWSTPATEPYAALPKRQPCATMRLRSRSSDRLRLNGQLAPVTHGAGAFSLQKWRLYFVEASARMCSK